MLEAIAVLISLFALAVSIRSCISSESASTIANNASIEANGISSQQLKISANSNKPEFVYNGPRDKEIINEESNISQSDEYYDYGFEPSFSKISGYASDLKCEAHSHYDFEIVKLSDLKSSRNLSFSHSSILAWPTILDVYGEFPRSEIDNDRTALTIYLTETRAKIDYKHLNKELEALGYSILLYEQYCAGELIYTDILDNTVDKPFAIDLQRKYSADFENPHANCDGIKERIDYDWNAPNRGLAETMYQDIAKDIVGQIENGYCKSHLI